MHSGGGDPPDASNSTNVGAAAVATGAVPGILRFNADESSRNRFAVR